MTTLNYVSNNKKYLLFVIISFLISYLHFIAELNIRGSLPPHSDSLVYQTEALQELQKMQLGLCSWREFIFGDDLNHTPPLYRWILEVAYIMFGVNNYTPVLIACASMLVIALTVYLIIMEITNEWAYAFSGGVALLATPAAIQYGFSEARINWISNMFVMIACYWFLKSDNFRCRRCIVTGAIFTSIAVLTSSTILYLAVPVSIIVAIILIKEYDWFRFCNVIIIIGIVAITNIWFYIYKYDVIKEYYQFWTLTNAANVTLQYQLVTGFDKSIFYLRNMEMQLGGFMLAIMVAGMVALSFRVYKEGFKSIQQEIIIAFIAFSPYFVLVSRNVISSLGDHFVWPFQVMFGFISMRGIGNGKVQATAKLFLLALAVFMNINGLIMHYRMEYYKGVDPQGGYQSMIGLISESGLRKIKIGSLYSDLYFNPITLVYLNMLDVINRNKYSIVVPGSKNMKMLSPMLGSLERYEMIVDQFNVIMIPHGDVGGNAPKWLAINKELNEYQKYIRKDARLFKVGEIAPYDNGVIIDIYIKDNAEILAEKDGWLVNGGQINVNARPGLHTLKLEGTAHGNTVMDMAVSMAGGGAIPGKECASSKGRCFEFMLDLKDFRTGFTVSSKTPLMPSSTGVSADTRELLILNPSVTIDIYIAEILAEKDGWLVNGGQINVNARPGLHTLKLEGTAHGNTVMDMAVSMAGGDAIPGKECASSKGRCFEFMLDLKDFRTGFTVSSKTPLTPSKTGASADTRELLILNPFVTIER